MYKIEQLNIFPLKSATGLSLQQVQLGRRGFVWDRHWMLVDAQGQFLTQRKQPRMTLIKTRLLDSGLELSAPGMSTLKIPFVPSEAGRKLSVDIWADTLVAQEVSAEASLWCSDFLQTDCHMVILPEDGVRQVDQQYAQTSDETGFSDGFPLLIISTASLDDLNARLEDPVDMIRFRPNIVVSGCEPYEEDRWKKIIIGDTSFRVVKPCSRCVIPTIDPATAAKHPRTEPLRTLSAYRKGDDGKVYFGQNVLHDRQGVIHVGDTLRVVE